MSQRVLFNGAVLVRPGASTKIDATQFENVSLSGIGIVGLIGEADGGQPRTVQAFTSAAAVQAFYKSGDLVEAAQIVAAPGNDPRIPTGAQAIVTYKVNNSTQASYVHAATHTFTSRQYGLLTNLITVQLTVGDSANERIVTITDIDAFGAKVTEVSPSLGALGKLSIQYTGAATTCPLTVTATGITTVTGTPSVPADDLAIVFSNFTNLAELVQFIDAHPSYTCTALVTNAVSFAPTNLDTVASVSVMTATSLFARNYDVAAWINANSQIITDTSVPAVAPVAVNAAPVALTGGTRGTSANSDWTTGLTALRGTRINHLVPLASANATTPQGTFTIASVLASCVAHAKFVSSTQGRNECQLFAGVAMTKVNLIAEANLHNSEHLVLVGQKPLRQRVRDGVITTMSEWALACILAGMRAGAPLGEPLTWKFIQAFGLTSDATWSEANNDDVTALTLNGVTVVNYIRGRGYRIDKCITTYTKADNDAYTEETIVQIWKALSYDIRRALEVLVGRPGTVTTIRLALTVMADVCEQYKQAGALTDSVINGARINAYRSLTASLTGDQLYVGLVASPTPGINFVLNTIALVPAQISL